MKSARSAFYLTLFITCLVFFSACGGHVGKPETEGAQLAFGVQMARQGLWSEALFRFRQAERLDPANPRILNNLAVAHEALGNYEKALDFYQSAVKSAPGNREVKANYARFVEFYRSFRADDATEETAEASAPSGGQA